MQSFDDSIFSLELELAGFGALHGGEVCRKFSVKLQLSDALEEVKRKHLLLCLAVHNADRDTSA